MSKDAEIVRDALLAYDPSGLKYAHEIAALDRLEAERDEALDDMASTKYAREQMYEGELAAIARAEAAEAERDELLEAEKVAARSFLAQVDLRKAAEAERDALRSFRGRTPQWVPLARAQAAEARVAELEAERDEWKQEAENESSAWHDEMHLREAAEARVAELTEIGTYKQNMIDKLQARVAVLEADVHMAMQAHADEEARVAVLEKALEQAIQVIEWCGENDKTPRYTYDKKLKSTTRLDGSLPGRGKAFNTPREFARYWPQVLRAALADGGDE